MDKRWIQWSRGRWVPLFLLKNNQMRAWGWRRNLPMIEAVEKGFKFFDTHALNRGKPSKSKRDLGKTNWEWYGIIIPRALGHTTPRLCGRLEGEESLEKVRLPFKEDYCCSASETGSHVYLQGPPGLTSMNTEQLALDLITCGTRG